MALGCGAEEESAAPAPLAMPAEAPVYLGAARCTACHATPAEAWRGSHHDRAMQVASEATVLGDFDGARFDHFGSVTTFSRRAGHYVVRTEGPDGALRDYAVAFTFGVDPLQQLLLRLPGGRLQAFGVAWDARPRETGGQRWFSLYPNERIPPDDVLHWTKPAQNWNSQCAECHSTNLRKGYDLARDAYDTTWSDPDVACEACHGPGSAHVAWAEAAGDGAPADRHFGLSVHFERSSPDDWAFAPGARIATRTRPLAERSEVETCAPCHARRSTIREGALPGEPLLDTYRPALLEAGLYESDGQMRDEVYVHGSFLQSRMYAAGVRCGDCHDPHALTLRAEGNVLCGRCHRPDAFDRPEHHHHAPGSAGAACVSCHMPARTYMEVDVRHDHSFRVPRPDLSASLGTPSSCTDCHAERPARWAADAVARWFPNGRTGSPHYAQALDAGRRSAPGADRALAALAADAAKPAIVRATALSLMPQAGAAIAADVVRAALADREPLVRLGALEAARALEPRERLAAVPLLRDPLRAVRIAAARMLADVPLERWDPAARGALAEALTEYRAAQLVCAERPEAHVSLGALHAGFGEVDAARREYQTALRLAPWFVPGYVNLADLERSIGRDEAAEALLRRALEHASDVAETHYALGLTLVRQKRYREALPELERAAALAPDSPRFALVAAQLLRELGDGARAAAAVERILARWPDDAAARAFQAELRAR